MSYSLHKISQSIFNLTDIFFNINKIADEEGLKQPVASSKAVGDKDNPEIARKSYYELQLEQQQLLENTSEILKESNLNQFQESADLADRVLDILAEKVSTYNKIDINSVSPEQRTRFNKQKRCLIASSILFAKLKIVYFHIVKNKNGVDVLVEILAKNGYDSNENILQDDLPKDIMSVIPIFYEQLRTVEGTIVRTQSLGNQVVKSLEGQGYKIEENSSLRRKIQNLEDIPPSKIPDRVAPNREQNSEKFKKNIQDLKEEAKGITDFIEDELRAEIKREQEDFKIIAERFGALEFVAGGEGSKQLEAGIRTLQNTYTQITENIIRRNAVRIEEAQERIRRLKLENASVESIRLQEKRLNQLETRATSNLNFRKMVSQKMDQILRMSADVGEKDSELGKQKLIEFKNLIKIISIQQSNTLSVARFFDFIDPEKAAKRIEIDPSKVSNLFQTIDFNQTQTSEAESKEKIEKLSNNYIEYKTKPTHYVGEAASIFKLNFPQWIKNIQSGNPSEWLYCFDKDKLTQEEDNKIQNLIIALRQNNPVDQLLLTKYISIIFNINIGYFEYLTTNITNAITIRMSVINDRNAMRAKIRTLSLKIQEAVGAGSADVDELKEELKAYLDPRFDAIMTPFIKNQINQSLRLESGAAEGEEDNLLNIINMCIEYCSRNNALIIGKKEKVTKAIVRFIKSQSDQSIIKKFFELLIAKVDSKILEDVKREIFVEMYLNYIGRGKEIDLGKIYTSDKVKTIQEAHKIAMEEFISTQYEYIKEYSSYAPFKSAGRVTRDLDLVISSLGNIPETEIMAISPGSQHLQNIANTVKYEKVYHEVNEKIKIAKSIVSNPVRFKLTTEINRFNEAMTDLINLYNNNDLFVETNEYFQKLYQAIDAFRKLRKLDVTILPPGSAKKERLKGTSISIVPKTVSEREATTTTAPASAGKFSSAKITDGVISGFIGFAKQQITSGTKETLEKINLEINKLIENLESDATLESLESEDSKYSKVFINEWKWFSKEAKTAGDKQNAIVEFNSWKKQLAPFCKMLQTIIAKKIS